VAWDLNTESTESTEKRDPSLAMVVPGWTFSLVAMLLTTETLHRVWLTITALLPVFFISAASKRLGVYVSGLESTLAGWFVSVASKWVSEGVV